MTLRATRPVLYRSRQYRTGDVLPGDDAAMVEAWIEVGSAAWIDDEETTKPPKAKRMAAQPGRTGLSSDGDPEALVGRVPDKPERKRGGKKA